MHDTDITTGAQPDFEDEGQIPDLKLHFRGEDGYVRFGNTDDLTGADAKRLRRLGAQPDNGQAANEFMAEAIKLLVTDWSIPSKPDMQIPRWDPKATDRIPGKLLRQIEDHIEPHMKWLAQEKKGDSDPFALGGPTAPASV